MIYIPAAAPTVEPVSIEQARAQIGLDSADTSMDTLLISLITVAREYVEKKTGRTMITGAWTGYLDGFFENEILIWKLPITEITSVKYYDVDNVIKTLTVNQDYYIDIKSEPARIYPAYGKSWPATFQKPNAVEIAFKAGYADADSVPKSLVAAMLLIIGHLEANRGDEGFRTMPPTIDLILNDYRLERI